MTAHDIDAYGIDDADRERLWRQASDPAAWIDANVEDIEWIHPRYRWILELDSQQMT